tara:strand:+ start:42985 stop:43308 length:324 start_codon:yes stop_codon:yes gene_type:complete
MKSKDVVFLCGDYPVNHKTPEIGSNPNYIFKNDPLYEQVRLFDYDGNTVLVNSFIECEHYVNGTWNYYPGKDEIIYLSWINGFLFLSLFTVIFYNKLIKKKRIKIEN